MKGQKNLHCLLAGILLSISSGSFAQPAVVVSSPEVTVPEPVASTPTMAELLQQPVYKARWQQMVKGQKNLPAWARKGAGTSGPYENIMWGAQQYKVGSLCKPHDCSNNFMWVAFSNDKKHVWGLRVAVADKPEALDNPSKFATYQWLGRPNENIQAMLTAQLEKDPNWR